MRHAVAGVGTGAGANLQGHRHIHRGDHGLQYAPHQRFVRQQGRASRLAAHFLGRAAHIDVDDLGAVGHIVGRRRGHGGRVVAGNLHRARGDFAVVAAAQAGLARIPQAGIAADHFRHHQARPELGAEPAEGEVRDAGHGSQCYAIGQFVGADLQHLGEVEARVSKRGGMILGCLHAGKNVWIKNHQPMSQITTCALRAQGNERRGFSLAGCP